MFGLSFRKPTPDQLDDDEYVWPMNEEDRQQRLASLRAHVQDLRAERLLEPQPLEPAPVPRPVLYEPPAERLYPPSVPWRTDPPAMPGLYWWRIRGLLPELEQAVRPRLCTVVDFGGRLAVRRQGTDSSTYLSVAALAREWAGPVAIPDDVLALEDLEL